MDTFLVWMEDENLEEDYKIESKKELDSDVRYFNVALMMEQIRNIAENGILILAIHYLNKNSMKIDVERITILCLSICAL
jgi:hypothetical protein